MAVYGEVHRCQYYKSSVVVVSFHEFRKNQMMKFAIQVDHDLGNDDVGIDDVGEVTGKC